jgi:hypothetical protein
VAGYYGGRRNRLWPDITAVGEALQVRKFLNGDEVSRLIESARKGEE